MNGTRDWGALVDARPEGQAAVGRKTCAMASGQAPSQSLASELVESSDGHEEILKVYLRGRSGDTLAREKTHEKSISQLKSEVQYIQEARNCLQKLREDISSKLDRHPGESFQQQEIQVNTCVDEDAENLRKTVQDLTAKLQEAEWQHQSDRLAFETTLSQYQREAAESNVALQKAEDRMEQKDAEIGALQRRVLGTETEHQALLAKVREGETALEKLRRESTDCQAEQEKVASLEKEVAGLREKIHHLDDMLKSQQRKVRQMIEQLQNSKAVIHSKDRTIQELKEKVAYLEAENLEMHDRMEHLIEKQISHGNFSTQTWAKTENLGSLRISKPPARSPCLSSEWWKHEPHGNGPRCRLSPGRSPPPCRLSALPDCAWRHSGLRTHESCFQTLPTRGAGRGRVSPADMAAPVTGRSYCARSQGSSLIPVVTVFLCRRASFSSTRVQKLGPRWGRNDDKSCHRPKSRRQAVRGSWRVSRRNEAASANTTQLLATHCVPAGSALARLAWACHRWTACHGLARAG